MFTAAEDLEAVGQVCCSFWLGFSSGSVRAGLVIDGSFSLSRLFYLFVYALSEFSLTFHAFKILRMPCRNAYLM